MSKQIDKFWEIIFLINFVFLSISKFSEKVD